MPFSYYTEPQSVVTEKHGTVAVGSGDDVLTPPGVSRVAIEFPDGNQFVLAPSEARALAEILASEGAVDDESGAALNLTPRPGQTFPVSTPLDSLKHAVLRTDGLLDVASEMLSTLVEDEPGERVQEILDSIRIELWRALAEHVDGVNPEGVGFADLPGFAEGKAPGAVWTEHVNRYDSGAPVRLAVSDGGVSQVVYTRLSPDTRTATSA